MNNTQNINNDITNKMHYKACSKCAGTMIFDNSWPGGALRCLQCGMTKELMPIIAENPDSDSLSDEDSGSDKILVA
jgi:hypothetical protein